METQIDIHQNTQATHPEWKLYAPVNTSALARATQKLDAHATERNVPEIHKRLPCLNQSDNARNVSV